MNAYITVFKTLGDETRLRIMHLFVQTNQALCVCELVDALGVPQYQVSRHIKQLRQSDLLKVKKQGTWSYYYLNKERGFRKQLFNFLENTLTGEALETDYAVMVVRLSYREKGRCVIGTIPHQKLLERIHS